MGGDMRKAPKLFEGVEGEVANWQEALGHEPIPIQDDEKKEDVPEVVALDKSFTQFKLAYLTKQLATHTSICSDSELCAHALTWRHTNP